MDAMEMRERRWAVAVGVSALIVVAVIVAARWVLKGAEIAATGTVVEASPPQGRDAWMKDGLDLLWTQGRPADAVPLFRKVLAEAPEHYGANYQIAVALQRSGHADEAWPYFELVLEKALGLGDADTVRLTTEALCAADRTPDAVMKQGLDALYTRQHAGAAAVMFGEALKRKPEHYGATYQLAAAMDKSGRRAEARPQWEKALVLAKRYEDAETTRLVTVRLAEKD
jgi:tetratricopeptide (TPR) repeat protein